MLNRIHQIQQTPFYKHLKTMLTGTVTGQLIMLAIIPVMARLFTPVDLAIYAFILALAGLSAVGAAMRYELTIILPQDDHEADKLLVFCLQSILITTLLLALLLSLLALFMPAQTTCDKLPDFIILLFFWPLLHISLSAGTTGGYQMTRQKNFKILSRSQIIRSSVTAGMLIITGSLNLGYLGLLISTLTGQLTYIILIWSGSLKYLYRLTSRPDLKLLARYRNFPCFSLPMSILNVFSIDLLLYALNFLTNPLFAGLYAKSVRIVTTPLSVLSLAFSNVFFQKLNSSANRIRIYNMAFISNLLVAFLLLSPLIFWGEELFAFVLGEPWRNAGKIAVLLLPLSIIRFAAGSVSQVYDVLHKNRIEFILHLIYLCSSITLLWYCLKIRQMDYYTAISSFSCWGATAYLALYFTGLYLLKQTKKSL